MDNKFLYNHLHWFHQKYYSNLKVDPYNYGRYTTIKIALNLFHQRAGKLILETGCQRQVDDWGGGCSTQVFSDYANANGCRLISVDNNNEHLQIAKTIIEHPEAALFYLSDSVEFLKSFEGKIDLLYLDSLDFPYGPILEDHGGKEDLDTALAQCQKLDEDFVVSKYGDLIRDCQEHCLRELQAAWPNLHKNSVILLDDALLPGGGKTRLARDFLFSQGWQLVLSGYQLVWISG